MYSSEDILDRIYASFRNTAVIDRKWSIDDNIIYVNYIDGSPRWDIFIDTYRISNINEVVDLHHINLLLGITSKVAEQAYTNPNVRSL